MYRAMKLVEEETGVILTTIQQARFLRRPNLRGLAALGHQQQAVVTSGEPVDDVPIKVNGRQRLALSRVERFAAAEPELLA
jgi:hypothetical protein